MKTILSRLSPEPHAAATSRQRYVRIIAGPGSGKTHTLAARAISLLADQGCSPHNLACVSFTRKASHELRERIEGELGYVFGEREAASMGRKITFGTMHSLCLGVIKGCTRLLGLPEKPTVLDQFDRLDIRRALAMKAGVKEPQLDEDLYRQHKLSIGAVDYDDLLTLTLEMMSRPDLPVLAAMRAKLRFVIYDEYQDIGPAEAAILGALAPYRLTVVGDPDQNIYSWRGTSLRFLLGFDTLVPEPVATFMLPTNWRSTHAVVTAANRLIKFNTDRIASKENLPVTDEPGTAKSAICAGDYKHYLRGEPWNQYAILARTNKRVAEIEDSLRLFDVPVRMLSEERSFWGAEPIRLVLAVLRVLENPRFDFGLERILDSGLLGRFTRRQIAEARLEAVTRNLPLWGGMRAWPEMAKLRRLVDDWNDTPFRDQPAVVKIGWGIGRLEIKKYFGDFQLRTGKRNRLDDLMLKIARWAAEEDEPTVEGFLSWSAMRDIQDGQNAIADAVTIGTVHAAKGLEWDCVLVAGMDQGEFPLEREGSDLEEERRLAYVAITRARKEVVMLRAAPLSDPSQFIAEAGL